MVPLDIASRWELRYENAHVLKRVQRTAAEEKRRRRGREVEASQPKLYQQKLRAARFFPPPNSYNCHSPLFESLGALIDDSLQ